MYNIISIIYLINVYKCILMYIEYRITRTKKIQFYRYCYITSISI